MTADKSFKNAARDLAAAANVSYSAARQYLADVRDPSTLTVKVLTIVEAESRRATPLGLNLCRQFLPSRDWELLAGAIRGAVLSKLEVRALWMQLALLAVQHDDILLLQARFGRLAQVRVELTPAEIWSATCASGWLALARGLQTGPLAQLMDADLASTFWLPIRSRAMRYRELREERRQMDAFLRAMFLRGEAAATATLSELQRKRDRVQDELSEIESTGLRRA